jgi:hypothetical protein
MTVSGTYLYPVVGSNLCLNLGLDSYTVRSRNPDLVHPCFSLSEYPGTRGGHMGIGGDRIQDSGRGYPYTCRIDLHRD